MRGIHIILCLAFLVAGSCKGVVINEYDTPVIAGIALFPHGYYLRNKPLVTGWYHVVDSGKGIARELGIGSTYYLDPKPIITASQFKTMTVESFPHDNTLWQVVAQLDEHGRAVFANATEELVGQDLVFVLDDSLWAYPIRIQAKIPNGVIVMSKRPFSKEEAGVLRDRIEASKAK